MAKVVKKSKKETVESIIIGKNNISLFLIGLVAIVIGFALMAQPPVNGFLSRTLAPIILVFAYLVIIPVSLFLKDKPEDIS